MSAGNATETVVIAVFHYGKGYFVPVAYKGTDQVGVSHDHALTMHREWNGEDAEPKLLMRSEVQPPDVRPKGG